MKILAPLVRGIDGIEQSLYTDDATIRTTPALSLGEQQDTLEEAVDKTESYLSGCDLACSPEKLNYC
ncbi:hypothetical protein HPB50_019140 [Hyalomma asiaticum]|uniref:Uncharacterized protein n=1 Tax=Hyalomma asiaticum TaxID=266040 RepID=A0ACB7SJM5_HYAAI|nr:hypothetical protein HPB50_019140 [Hyalomma asiaticum]